MRGTRAIPLILLALGLQPGAAHAEFKSVWPVDGRLGLINSSVPGNTADQDIKGSGVDVEASFAPILGWTGSRWLVLPLAEADYNTASQIIKVDDQRYLFLEQLDSRFELGTAWRVTPDTRFSLRGFNENFQAKQAANEQLSTGQYNYQDVGAGVDWKSKWNAFVPMKTTVGLALTDRQYPNWLSLDPSQLR